MCSSIVVSWTPTSTISSTYSRRCWGAGVSFMLGRGLRHVAFAPRLEQGWVGRAQNYERPAPAMDVEPLTARGPLHEQAEAVPKLMSADHFGVGGGTSGASRART